MPPGAPPGHTVDFGGKGAEHPDKLPGSVRVVAVQLAHPRFERQGEAGFEQQREPCARACPCLSLKARHIEVRWELNWDVPQGGAMKRSRRVRAHMLR